MGTRGIITIIFKNKTINLYNHWDSYFSGLGLNLIKELLELLNLHSVAQLIELFDNVKIVTDETEVTDEDIEHLKPFTELHVGNRSTQDWYCLLRGCQGSISKVLESGYALDSGEDFGIGIEYVYIINLNAGTFTCSHEGVNVHDVPLKEKEISELIDHMSDDI